ncbi:MAG: sulfide/dihydroorotate dehydrogenase-like FAD/NAD-binding protein [Peptostreptococcaceae bacterium]
MYRGKNKICIDCGSKYCPCHLAYSGDCIKCSLIRGEKICDCSWQGTCVYNEVKHNMEKLTNQREEYLCEVLEKKEIAQNCFLFKIQIPNLLGSELSVPGAYVLLKAKNKQSDIYNAPISVMDVDKENGVLEVVIKVVGIKTKVILESNEIKVKGPYFNGIFGIDKINQVKNSNCVVLLNGLSQVNSINVIKKLLQNKNTVEVFYDASSNIIENVREKLIDLGVNVHMINIDEDKNIIIDYIKRNKVALVYSGGNNEFNKEIKTLLDEVDKEITLAISNNNLICCGEGICGGCTVNLNGERVKSCKAQINSRDLLQNL